jgi:ribosomal protein S18 acetylase RimI-like enzyme
MNIVTLTAADAPRYRTLMLEAYTLAADAYTSTAQDRAREPDTWWVQRVADASGLTVSFGAEIEGTLVGTVALEYVAKPKTKHSALVIGMYVQAAARRLGIGRALLQAALAHAAARPGVEVVELTVTEGNASAIAMYAAAGFQTWGMQPWAIATPSGVKGKAHMSRRLHGDDQAPGASTG